jgi:hypothetical protein
LRYKGKRVISWVDHTRGVERLDSGVYRVHLMDGGMLLCGADMFVKGFLSPALLGCEHSEYRVVNADTVIGGEYADIAVCDHCGATFTPAR